MMLSKEEKKKGSEANLMNGLETNTQAKLSAAETQLKLSLNFELNRDKPYSTFSNMFKYAYGSPTL